jgi:hypothetical protein
MNSPSKGCNREAGVTSRRSVSFLSSSWPPSSQEVEPPGKPGRFSVVQIDLLDAPGQHASSARGLLKPALELYRLVPGEPPTTSEARLLWDIGEAVHRYVHLIFDGGLLCPSGPRARDNAPGLRGDASP